jgi:uncharacterized protein (DUF952 family)
VIYHLLTSAEWEAASHNLFYSPAAFAADGFIHCCNAEQLVYVGDRHFHGRLGLVILCIDASRVTAPIKYEDLNGEGMLFPHIYGRLNTDAVERAVNFLPDADGTFRIPPAIGC